jgi:hypothetical protein
MAAILLLSCHLAPELLEGRALNDSSDGEELGQQLPRPFLFQATHYRTIDEKHSYAPTAESASLHARSQRLHTSAHTRQCSMFISWAWRSHSSPHNRHASAQA